MEFHFKIRVRRKGDKFKAYTLSPPSVQVEDESAETALVSCCELVRDQVRELSGPFKDPLYSKSWRFHFHVQQEHG